MIASVVILLASSAPALAQTAGPDQYEHGTSTSSVADVIHDSTETAAEGTKAANEALSGTASPGSSAPSASSSPDKVAGLTELPETGGVAFPLLLGALLVATGVLIPRIVR